MKRIEIKKQKKRADILASAYELFTTTGYEETSMFNIAVHAGVGKGTLYLYFDSKEAIRDELIRIKASQILTRAIRDLDYSIDEAPLSEPIDAMIDIIDNIVGYMIEDPAQLKFLSKNLSWGLFKDDVADPSDNVLDFKGFVEEILRKQDIVINNIEIVLFTILELISSTCYSTIINGEPLGIEEYKPFLYDCVRAIMSKSIAK